jgi:hypothetical protein
MKNDKVKRLINYEKTSILHTLDVFEMGTSLTSPVMNLVKISTRVKGIGFEDDFISGLRPFHRRQVGMTLYCLPEVVDAVPYEGVELIANISKKSPPSLGSFSQ